MMCAEVERMLATLTEGEDIKLTFIPKNAFAPVCIGAKVVEVCSRCLIVDVAHYNGGRQFSKLVAIEIWSIFEIRRCQKSEVSNRYIRMIRENVKYPNTDGEYGRWDSLPISVRQFLVECAEHMILLEIIAQERDLLEAKIVDTKEVLQNLIKVLNKKYEEARDNQHRGTGPSGRMRGLNEAIMLVEDFQKNLKGGGDEKEDK